MGQTGYNGHPLLKTPHLDAMAAAGLRLDRFYASAPVCSPTRASVLTGRAGVRTGVPEHGFPLRLQEKTIAQALRSAGYATAHFGKWHLSGLRGPGVPLFADDLFPTLVDLLRLPRDAMIEPVDGESLVPLFSGEPPPRTRPLMFRFHDEGAAIDGSYKLVAESLSSGIFRLYDLASDPSETTDRTADLPAVVSRLRQAYDVWLASVEASVAGHDYPERTVTPPNPEPLAWTLAPRYRAFLDEWAKRWEYGRVIETARRPRTPRP